MSKRTRGADRGDGIIIHRGNRDLRKITCPKCHTIATMTKTASGKTVIKCHGCGCEFTTTQM